MPAMSEPKRYKAAGNGVVRTDHKGDLVLYIDYARLLAEVKELKSQPDPLTAYLYAAELAKDDIKTLKAQVERLTEAGDHMAAVIIEYRCSPWGRKVPNAFTVWQAWFNAKEGKGQP